MKSTAWALDERSLRVWDAVVVLWVMVWLLVGLAVGYEIHQLDGLARSTVDTGQSLAKAGQALSGLGKVPVIGEQTATLGDDVSTTAAEIIVNGDQARSSIRGLSVLIGFAVAGIPAGAALGAYLPVRRARRKDAAGIVAAVAKDGLTPDLEGYLARRAVVTLPAATVLTVTSDPHGDLIGGRHSDLAAAELSRLGIQLTAGPA